MTESKERAPRSARPGAPSAPVRRGRSRGPELLATAVSAVVFAQVTCAPAASIRSTERPGRPVDPGAAEAAAGEPEAPVPAERQGGVFDPERPETPLWRRPAGVVFPDTIGTLLPRRARTNGEPSFLDRYLLYLPPGLGEVEGQWPLILYLHGRSLRGRDLERVKRYGLPSFLARGWDVPFVVVAPQLPDDRYWDDPERLVELVREVTNRYPVDEARIYLTGFSLGAGGVWEVLKQHADPFAAAIPISAWTPSPATGWLDAVDGLPLRLYHGTHDEAAPYDRTLEMHRHLSAAGHHVELVTLEGAGHGIVQDVYRDPELYAWLLRHRRAPPRRVEGR